MPRRKKGSSTGGGSGKSLMHKGKPQQRNAANARERARMRVLSRAFCRLKTTLPWVPADTKLSKLDTLRLAASYIAHLKGILRDEPLSSEETGGSHPSMSLTWPFGFNRPTTLLGGNGSSVGGGSEAEESIGGSSSCWEPESPTKDCVHLENPGQNELSLGRHLNHPTTTHPQPHHHLHLQQQEEPPLKSDIESVMLHNNNNNPCNTENNNIIPYNFHQGHHDHQQHSSNMSYGYQNDVIMSLS